MSSETGFEEKLILLVKKNPPIYDKKDRAYKDRGPGGVVANIWQDIYVSLNDLYPNRVTGM